MVQITLTDDLAQAITQAGPCVTLVDAKVEQSVTLPLLGRN